MKLPLRWLKEYVDYNVTNEEFVEKMMWRGFEIASIDPELPGVSGVVVGKVLDIKKHENSDHMWVCKVDVGQSRDLTIVTGAQNVSVGDMVPAAVDGATLPGGKEIHTGVLRGVTSEGMLCSLGELGLDQHDYPYAVMDGIFILQEPCEVGDDIRKVLGLGDTVVEFEITNNRPDCLSIIGLARETAATFGTELQLHTPEVKGCGGSIMDDLDVEIEDPALCPRYTARMVKKEHPNAKIVFVGPCAAKKLEAIRENIRSDVDFVLTFEELMGMFEAKEVDFENLPEVGSPDEGTAAGRGFAVAGGVAAAVVEVVHEKHPDMDIKVANAQGLRDCRKLMNMAKVGKYNGYLLEGMACPGGCIAGAGTILSIADATKGVEASMKQASKKNPLESQYAEMAEELD